VQGHRPLARINDLLPLEVPIGGAAPHKTSPCSAHKADIDFLMAARGCKAGYRCFCEKPERKWLEVGARGREACFAKIHGAVQTRRRSDDTSVIFS